MDKVHLQVKPFEDWLLQFKQEIGTECYWYAKEILLCKAAMLDRYNEI